MRCGVAGTVRNDDHTFRRDVVENVGMGVIAIKRNASAQQQEIEEKRRADAEWERAEAEKQRADAEWEKAEVEKQRADAEWEKAEAEKQRAEAERLLAEEAVERVARLEAKLRALGVEP